MARAVWTTVLALAFVLAAMPAFAQGNSAALSGTVQDKDGNVPGATVTLKNVNTGETYPAQVTNASGQYSFPGLTPGTYKVTITMTGYKTVEVETRLTAATSNTLPPTKLEVGERVEVVTVRGSSDLVRTDTPTVSQTVNADFIQRLPRVDRNALNFLVFLPGVQMVGGAAGDGARDATVAGLPQRTINITIDGTTNSNLLQSTDGFFSMVVPRLDAVEEVTLTTASAGADASGQGAVQIRFVTRSGTNRYEASLYWFQQHAVLNSNSYFTRLSGNPVPQATNYTYGGRIGGPIVLPGFDGRGKAFFFFNQEELYNPFENLRTRTLIRQSALDGNFTYGPTAAPITVNVMTLANAFQAANPGIPNVGGVYDPTIKALLESSRAAAATVGTITEVVTSPNTASYQFLSPTKTINHAPTTNITVNLTPKHRLQGSYYWLRFKRDPDALNGGDPIYPGFPAYGNASQYRTTASMSLRSTLSTSIVNELRGGWQWSPVGFNTNATADMFVNQGGYHLDFPLITDMASTDAVGPSERNTANWTIADQVNWLKGSHNLTMGGDFTRVDDYGANWNTVNTANIGFLTNQDPAEAMFTAANFPGSTTAERTTARALFALLTGRISSLPGTGRLDESGDAYIYNGKLTRRETQDDYSFYAQDTWRWKPTLTLTAGLRYQFTLPMTAKAGTFTAMTTEDACGPSGFGEGPGGRFCNMFNPGSLLNPTVTPEYYLYSSDTKGYSTDFNNLAPNVGVAWRPNVQDGFMRKLLGDPELATINAGWTRSFNRERLDGFLSVYNGNAGQTIPLTRGVGTGQFPLVGATEFPLLYSQKDKLGAPTYDPTPIFPVPASFANGASVFNPNIEVPITDSWNVSFQRSLTKDTVVEIRYQGNISRQSWTLENWNAINVYETGWLTGRNGAGMPDGEFEKAQANLRANVLAGLGGTFAYTGIPGTQPLPITLAHLNGLGPSAAGTPRPASCPASNAAPYCGNLWTNATFVGSLDPFNAAPATFASNLYLSTSTLVPTGMSTRFFNNAMAADPARYASNYWALNPQLSSVDVQTNSDNRPTNNFVILQMRRRLAQGLAAQVAYTWQRSFSGSLQDFHIDRFYLRSTGIPHAIQTLWTYDIPVGRGKRIGANMDAWANALIGGWTFSGTARFQRQSFVLRNSVLVGMSIDEARDALSVIRFVTDPVTGAQSVFNFPEDIYTNTRLAYATDETRANFYVPGTEPNGPLGIPTADGRYRYFMRAGGVDAAGNTCNFLYPGDCGTQDLWFNGRWFGEMDFRLAKQFELPGRARFEFSAEVFNATKAINFPNVINPGTGGGTFQITSSQSGARTAQLVWRVSW